MHRDDRYQRGLILNGARVAAYPAVEHVCAGGKSPGPPPVLTYEVVGHLGNEWELPVRSDGLVLQVRVVQRPDTTVREANFDIAPTNGRYPPAIRQIPVGRQLTPGVHDVEVRWDGRDQSGQRAAPGRYRLFGASTTNSQHEVTCVDGSGQGVEQHIGTSEAAGLGILMVD